MHSAIGFNDWHATGRDLEPEVAGRRAQRRPHHNPLHKKQSTSKGGATRSGKVRAFGATESPIYKQRFAVSREEESEPTHRHTQALEQRGSSREA